MRIKGDISDPDLSAILNALTMPSQKQSYFQVSGKQDINALIMQVRQQYDASRYIQSKFVGGPSTATLLRDAGSIFTCDEKDPARKAQVYNALNRDERNTAKAYLIMALNYTAAVQLLLDANHKQYNKDALLTLCKKMLQFADMDGENLSSVVIDLGMKGYFFEYVQRVLVPIMLAAGLANNANQAVRILDKVKDWVPLQHESTNVATLVKLEDAMTRAPFYVLMMEKPVVELTSVQRKRLRNYVNEYWFKCLSAEEKAVFKLLLPDLLEGRVIPSQLRSRLPLLKNAYVNSTFVLELGEDELNVRLVSGISHCGSLVYFDKKSDPNEKVMQEITTESMFQQVYHVKNKLHQADGRPWQNHMMTLCSEHGDDMRAVYEDWRQWFWPSDGLLPLFMRIPILISFVSLVYLPLLVVVKLLKLIITLFPFGQSIWSGLSSFSESLYRNASSFLSPLKNQLITVKHFLFGTYSPYLGLDPHVVRKTRNASAGSSQCFSSNSCANEFSLFESHDLRGIMEIYRQGQVLLNSLEQQAESHSVKCLALALQRLRDEIGTVSFLLAFNQTKSKRGLLDYFCHYFLRLAEPVSRFLSGLFDERVRAMQIVVAAQLLVYQINNLSQISENREVPLIYPWINCCSGENRTYLLLFMMLCEAIIREKPAADPDEIRRLIAESRHVQTMTGYQGSIAGTEGVRRKSMKSLPAGYHGDQLETPWSDMKSLRKELQKWDSESEVKRLDPDFFQRAFGSDPAAAVFDAKADESRSASAGYSPGLLVSPRLNAREEHCCPAAAECLG